jgi:hypothetical protein
MGETLYVTPAQVLAAKLAIELSEEAGQAPDEALKAIANAQELAPQQSAPSPRASSLSQALLEFSFRLQRIEDQLQVINPEASGQERPQPSTQQPHDPKEPPWMRNRRDDNPSTVESPSPPHERLKKEPSIGTGTEHLEVAQRSGTPEEQEEAERTIARYKREHPERQRGPQDRNIERQDPDTDGPSSGGIQR